MAVTLHEVERVAMLAKLSFSNAEKDMLTHHLNDVLKHMEQLDKLDTSNVEPLAQVIELNNVFRADETRHCLTRADALKNAPAQSETFFQVPKVIADR